MSQIVYNTLDQETGQTINTRSVQSPIIKPKIASEMEKENVGFWEKHFDWVQGPEDIYNFWSKGQGGQAVGGAAKKVGGVFSTGLGKITTLALIIAAIVIVPRVLPRR